MKNILLLILILTNIYFVILYFIVKNKIMLISSKVAQTVINRQKPVEGIIDPDSFIKFLSDSREWAFEYIEEVQNVLKKFDNEIGSDIKYFDEYGDVVAMKPNYDTLNKISIAYKDLQKILPKD